MHATISKETPIGGGLERPVRHGFGVQVTCSNGNTFLATSGSGIMPFVHPMRHWAVEFCRELACGGTKGRVVPVTFTDVVPNDKRSHGEDNPKA